MTTSTVDAAVHLPAAQQPDWPDASALAATVRRLGRLPPLVLPTDCDDLQRALADVAEGRSFLLQGGDCAERLDPTDPRELGSTLRTMDQMGAVVSAAVRLPVVTVGRLAGQYAKPRSRRVERRDGVVLPVYRGDAVNSPEFTPAARTAQPARLERVYAASLRTLTVLREHRTVPADVWDALGAHAAGSPWADRYGPLLDRLRSGGTGTSPATGRPTRVYASHEALLLDYERAMCRVDPVTGDRYGLSGHLLWIGERTRDPDGAHVAFAAGVANPVAVKLGPATRPDDLARLVDLLDPGRSPGRLTLITRLGAGGVTRRLPALLDRVAASGARPVWICDPMHGNTFEVSSGVKTRRFDDVVDELRTFFQLHRAHGTHPGGVHLELTGADVTECLGGGEGIRPSDLHRCYETACDPRLSRGQALDLAFAVAEFLSA